VANPFKYLARDLLTWEPLDALPYVGVSFGKTLDQHGQWSGSLPLAPLFNMQTQQLVMDWPAATRVSRTALFVELEGVLVWSGIVWTQPPYESDDLTHSLKINAQEFGSYYTKRLQAEDYSTLWEHGGDPMEIIKRIIEDAQAKEVEDREVIVGSTTGALTKETVPGPGYITNRKIPIVVHGPTGSEFDVEVQYPATSLQTADSINSTLTAIGYGPGYDFSWDAEMLNGEPVLVLNLYRPVKGRTAEESGIVILGRECKWTWPVDGTSQALEVTETGSGTGGLEPATATANYPGYPLMQKATARTQITTERLLEVVALGDLALCGWPVVSPTLTLPLPFPGTPQAERHGLALGEFDVGDRLMFKVHPAAAPSLSQEGPNVDPRFPFGCEVELRINAWTVKVEDHGLSTLTLDCAPPPLGFVPPPAPPGI
jgi:hypothetical protein